MAKDIPDMQSKDWNEERMELEKRVTKASEKMLNFAMAHTIMIPFNYQGQKYQVVISPKDMIPSKPSYKQ